MIDLWTYLTDRLTGRVPPGTRRHPHWPAVRRRHLQEHPTCHVCGATRKLDVHHLIPFNLAPELELDPRNLMTLCRHGRYKGVNCHLMFGHQLNWRDVNPHCLRDSNDWRNRLQKPTT